MPYAAIIGGGAALLGSLISGNAATDAASTQAAAATRASGIQANEYLDIANKLLPFLQSGTTANEALSQLFGINGPTGHFDSTAPLLQPISATVGAPPNPNDPALRSAFLQSPGYNYQLQTSNDAIANSAAGRSGAVSGNMLKALQTNSANLAGTDWWNNYNAVVNNYGQRYNDIQNQRNTIIGGLGGLGAAGQSAAVQQGGFGQNAAAQIGSNTIGAGNALAAGRVGASNALTGGINSILPYLMGGSGTNFGSGIAGLISQLTGGGAGQDGSGGY